VSVTWRDGTETVEDAESIALYGLQSRSLTTQATTAEQARSAAEWVVANYSSPRARVRGLSVNAAVSANALAAAQALRPGDLVTLRTHPQQAGSASTVSLFVEGATHRARGKHRTVDYRLSPDHTFTPWVWGTSAWGVDNYWG
jgi:hypothetical protein